MAPTFPAHFAATSKDAGQRLDQFLTSRLDVSRARVQELLHAKKILLNDAPAKASTKLRGGERIIVLGPAERPPLRAIAEPIPLDIVYEDDDLAVINKPAGMKVHAGAGISDPHFTDPFRDTRNRGTLVNALLHHFSTLSTVGGELRPGIVHRLDKETSGLIVVAKNDRAHTRLADQFAQREVQKKYIALVHGWLKKDRGTVALSISRDRVRRIRMTTRNPGGRAAVSHYQVVRRIDSRFGPFSLIEVKIDTGRTHQIRVHMAALGHPVVGDKLYGAPAQLQMRAQRANANLKKSPLLAKSARSGAPAARAPEVDVLSLPRNFLHSAELVLTHPRSGKQIAFKSPLPPELLAFLAQVEEDGASNVSTN
jgi:23S rRNA pseudouridine1911/1915/1917 synthase